MNPDPKSTSAHQATGDFAMDAITLPGTLDALSPIRDYVKEAAASAGLDHSATYDLLLAVDEIATNVVVHGYEEAGLQGNISVAATRQDDALVITLSDTGKSYDPRAHKDPVDADLCRGLSDRPIGGLGIMLAKDGVDDLQYESTENGNVHRFVVRLQPPPGAAKPASATEASDEHRRFESLLMISKSFGLEIQLDSLLNLVVADVTAVMQAERSTLFLVDHKKPDELVSRIAEELASKEIRVNFGSGIAGITAETRRPINISDAYADRRFNPAFDALFGFRTRSILSTPILSQSNQLIGVLQVINKKGGRTFTKQDEQFLDVICVHLSRALERAQMVEAYLQSQIVAKSLELARDIQMGLVPKDFPALPEFKEIEIYATILPALDVGGDFYDFFPLDQDRICFIIGDVSGKGVPAALFMAMARTAFKISATASTESIGHTMARVNQFLCEGNPQQMFVTALAGILDLRTGRVDYADAGHEPPFILEPSGNVLKVNKVGGLVLGFLPGEQFREGTIQLNPADSLVLYTDGVTEAMDFDHKLFGAPAIEKTLLRAGQAATSEEIINVLLEAMHVFVGEAEQSDDITMLVIKYLGRGDPSTLAVQ
jgi:serine phosphatase RsbU (regulator of sigma subunit)/anti-sigma regulatory factor (Ser/Thr protein kinase)